MLLSRSKVSSVESKTVTLHYYSIPFSAVESPNPKQPVSQPSPWIELKFCMIIFYVERIMCRVKTVTLRHCSMPSSPDLGDQGNPHQTKNLCFKSFGVRNLQKRLKNFLVFDDDITCALIFDQPHAHSLSVSLPVKLSLRE